MRLFEVVLFAVTLTISGGVPLDLLTNSIERGLSYLLESRGISINNASMDLAIGSSELYRTLQFSNITNLELVEKLNWYRTHIDQILQMSLQNNSDAVENALSTPDYWIKYGNYKFRKAKIINLGPLPQTVKQVLRESQPSLKVPKCFADLLHSGISENKRRCKVKLPCYEAMHNPCVQEGKKIDFTNIDTCSRMRYIAIERILNCTNTHEKVALYLAGRYCTYFLRQIKTIVASQFTDETRYYFLNKMLMCGLHGFAEFYNDDIVLYAMHMQNNKGFFGKEADDEGTRNMLTAEAVAVLCSALRHYFTFNKQ